MLLVLEKIINHLLRLGDDIIGIAETHLREGELERTAATLRNNWCPTSYSPATPSSVAEDKFGNTGGVLLMRRPSLHSAAPIQAACPRADVFGSNDIVWTDFRVRGLHVAKCFCYFEHSIGLTGRNLERTHFLNSLRDGGRRKLMCTGDWNCPPVRLVGKWIRAIARYPSVDAFNRRHLRRHCKGWKQRLGLYIGRR